MKDGHVNEIYGETLLFASIVQFSEIQCCNLIEKEMCNKLTIRKAPLSPLSYCCYVCHALCSPTSHTQFMPMTVADTPLAILSNLSNQCVLDFA